jgi:hypothetical protein
MTSKRFQCEAVSKLKTTVHRTQRGKRDAGPKHGFFFNERFIALINIRTYMTVTKLFRKYNQLTTVS